jgi:pyruvate carboxylase
VLDLLFVYGTLRRGFARHKFLGAAGAKFEGKASVRGRLYDLGDFPGVQPAPSASARVAGEVYRSPNVERALKILDDVEGFNPVSPQTSLFRREIVDVKLENRPTVRAWIYWLNHSQGPRRTMASGDYARNGKL